MSITNYDDLVQHVGHRVVVSQYGDNNDPVNVAIECEDCYEVLFDYEKRDRFAEMLQAQKTGGK